MIVSELKKEIKIKAAILEKLNSPLVIRELELTELKIGQVVVQVLTAPYGSRRVWVSRGNRTRGYQG